MSKFTEASLLTACLKAGDISVPLKYGIDGKRFRAYGVNFQWAVDWYHKHGYVPAVDLMLTQFPTFPVSEVQGSTEEIELLCHQIRESWISQDLTETATMIVRQLQKKESPSAILGEVKAKLDQVTFSAESRATEIVNDWELAYREMQRRELRSEQHGAAGVPTGFPTLDVLDGGMHAGEYWVFAGRLGEGKTWSLIKMACHAVANGLTVQFHSLEMHRARIQTRCLPFLARHAALELPSTRTSDTYRQAFEGIAEATAGKLVVDDTPAGKATVSSIAAQIETNKPDIVMVDYLTLLTVKSGDWQEITGLSAEIKGMAQNYEIPVVVAAQINREGSGGLPSPHHIAGSDAIGRDADGVVTMIYRAKGDRVLEMGLRKYRHGRDGMAWYCHFDPERGVFDEITADEAKALRELDVRASG